MYKHYLTINAEAHLTYFTDWLRENYSPNFSGSSQGGNLILYFESEPDEEDLIAIETYYSNITSTDCLDIFKLSKINEINDRTGELILLGYSFAGKQFPLSSNGQTNLLALYTTRNEPALLYPIEMNTLDDLDHYMITGPEIIEGMYLTALATKKTHLDSGTALKDLVRAAVTEEEINSIIDNR